MKKESKQKSAQSKDEDIKEQKVTENSKHDFPAYPDYPPNEDIFNREKEVDIDPDNFSKTINTSQTVEELSKTTNIEDKPGKKNEKAFNEDVSGDDLDVPGSELDDSMEIVGSEDEENNLYSLGGEDHEDLEEDKGD